MMNLSTAPSSTKLQSFFVGSYTDGESDGIYKYILHEDGSLTKAGLVAKADNPSFLAISADRKFLVAINEVNLDETGGRVESYLIKEDKLELLSRESSAGSDPCFVAISSDNFILTANYTSGTVGLLQLNDDGIFSKVLDTQQHLGSGTADRQNAAHAHSVWFVPGGDDIIALDLGTNQMCFYQLNKKKKKLGPLNQESLTLSPGAGPRHLAFHPDGKWIYVVNELNSSISHIEKSSDGLYREVSACSTLPETYEKENTCSDLRISADGKFFYVANRGHNSISVFKASFSDGSLELLGRKSCGGESPRSFSLSPDEKFLLIANQKSNNIVVLSRDKRSGLLKYKHQIEAFAPSSILF